mmetsp:Transcript_1383/g.4390  ORF Transcript_1383/g.4390 Transcript_1383/m.4390 type:complete len:205 (+) Transcript_1383:591-1205(+)
MPVGTSRPVIVSSGMLSRYLSMPRIELPVVVARPVFVAHVDGGRRRGERPAPELHLVLAILLDSLLLVEARQGAVHALVKAPIVVHNHMLLACDSQNNVKGLLRALEQRRVAHIELDALLPDLRGAHGRLVLAQRGEAHVRPASEEVGLIPLRLAVAQEDNCRLLVRGSRSHGRGAGHRRQARGDPARSRGTRRVRKERIRAGR